MEKVTSLSAWTNNCTRKVDIVWKIYGKSLPRDTDER